MSLRVSAIQIEPDNRFKSVIHEKIRLGIGMVNLVSGFRFLVSGFRFSISGSAFRVSGICFRVSSGVQGRV